MSWEHSHIVPSGKGPLLSFFFGPKHGNQHVMVCEDGTVRCTEIAASENSHGALCCVCRSVLYAAGATEPQAILEQTGWYLDITIHQRKKNVFFWKKTSEAQMVSAPLPLSHALLDKADDLIPLDPGNTLQAEIQRWRETSRHRYELKALLKTLPPGSLLRTDTPVEFTKSRTEHTFQTLEAGSNLYWATGLQVQARVAKLYMYGFEVIRFGSE